MMSDSFCLWLILKLKESVSPYAHVKLKSFWTFLRETKQAISCQRNNWMEIFFVQFYDLENQIDINVKLEV